MKLWQQDRIFSSKKYKDSSFQCPKTKVTKETPLIQPTVYRNEEKYFPIMQDIACLNAPISNQRLCCIENLTVIYIEYDTCSYTSSKTFSLVPVKTIQYIGTLYYCLILKARMIAEIKNNHETREIEPFT